ncbi:conserved hypothetical protein (DUF1569) [Formosa agariphila KMM 3901]|uniref:DUF1569 domain-containing protein n=1 Tax=Formosa agariphila (strain DSM 15362 / KCTC 12365 / LMG 23005 / KMM 3901 / M-2Alg 35-1) TaxID=1347342 RepID=T2KHD0_FORAG|nr:DUF1569 domain-containing protein [Formosa agariphila]CDF78257.1 conserved hypothetical protein (DUF1569) [Formosa agariphila KMM 3901]
MNTLFNASATESIISRIQTLTENDIAIWGKMDAAQMLKHCQGPLNIALGHEKLNSKIGFIQKTILSFYKTSLYNDKPWKKNLPTAKEFVIKSPHIFLTEKENLILLIEEFSKKTEVQTWPDHPLFGYFTPEQWGKMQYKHLHHHLTQFNV